MRTSIVDECCEDIEAFADGLCGPPDARPDHEFVRILHEGEEEFTLWCSQCGTILKQEIEGVRTTTHPKSFEEISSLEQKIECIAEDINAISVCAREVTEHGWPPSQDAWEELKIWVEDDDDEDEDPIANNDDEDQS